MIALMHEYLVKAFSAYEPISHMIMSRDTGLLNDYFNIEKSQLIDLYQFCTM